MKKFFLVLISMIVFLIPTVYAEDFDTNKVSQNEKPDGSSSSKYKYWAYYKTTGTRYVIRVYDWNTGKYVAVPKEYYINHVYGYKSDGSVNTNKQVMYLGVDKNKNGKYTVVKSGKTIFKDNTYSHVIKWFDNSKVSNFGLTKNDVNLLAQIVKDSATKNGNIEIANKMQSVIDGTVPYDVRAEILFLMKMPGTSGKKRNATVAGNGSVEKYKFTFYDNEATSSTPSNEWRKEYITYLEVKAICYKLSDECGMTMKEYWLDKIACALYERHSEYVFVDGTYQCSCDLYKRKYSDVKYTLKNKQICINKASCDPEDETDRWYMYLTPGRCGIPIDVSGTTYYLTPGKTYSNINGKKVKVNTKIDYSDTSSGIKAHDTDYLSVVTGNSTRATIYEGWDYITSNLAATLVLACDKNTGNIISLNGVTYSKFETVGEGVYSKIAWNISGYEYLGYIVRDDFLSPDVPLGVADTGSSVNINISREDVENGARKQVIFVYQKSNDEVLKEARLSIYNVKDGINEVMYTGSFKINEKNKLAVNLYDKGGLKKHTESLEFDVDSGYKVNTFNIENILGLNDNDFKYVGNLIKVHEEYFLSYLGESLNSGDGDVYNLKDIGENKVHIILGYEIDDVEEDSGENNPKLKISYIDEEGNPLPGKDSVITDEEKNVDINSPAEDLKEDYYIYVGYTYVDSDDEFLDIVSPLTIIGNEENVVTNFAEDNDRRHIAFVYKKIKIEFEIDIMMDASDLANQFIGQKADEDYWVLDESGKVTMKVIVSEADGLNILDYKVKLRIPFDTYINGVLIPANSVNNLTVNDLSNVIVADKLTVPIWVNEGTYNIDAIIEANVDGFGLVSSSEQEDLEVVGRLYDFTVTNLDGSNVTGDEMWKSTLFKNENLEYKADSIPVGQRVNQPAKYNYGIKLGTSFYFSINTKGIKNDAISILPKFLYVSKDGASVKEVDVYFNDNGRYKNMLSGDMSYSYMKLKDDNVLKSNVIREIEKAQAISAILERYKYSTTENRNIGKLSNIVIPKYLSLPYLDYINEFKGLYGENAIMASGKSENELLTYASHWYGKYVVPASSKVVDIGASVNSKGYEDGYLIVCFKIISLDVNGAEYLAYDLPADLTQWKKENLNQVIDLPIIINMNVERLVTVDTVSSGYAPVIVYQIGVSTKDNNSSVGTH